MQIRFFGSFLAFTLITTHIHAIILPALGASTVAYTIHRGAQSYTRAHKPVSNSEEKLANPKGIVTLFVHGFGADRYHGEHYRGYNVFTLDPNVTADNQLRVFDFQDSPLLPQTDRKPSCLAQDADIKKLKEEYDRLVAQGYQVNLHGVSRGASTIINFLALHQPKNVRCAVLESPFDDLESIVHHKLIGIRHIPLVGSMLSAAITAAVTKLPIGLHNHTVYGINPRDGVKHIAKDIPLLFLSSKGDALIPYTSTQKLAKALPHSYSMVVDKGSHASILNGPDGRKAIAAIQKFVANPTINPVPDRN